jgi:hypothetical protein
MTLQPDFNDKKTLEKYSSAFTLSDMEVFIFPELIYPLVLANIMSPQIWNWKEDEWFKGIEKKSFTFKINRIKQYIMDHYVFNLDLETWGITTKEKEISRFKDFFPVDVLAQSNALFGYEGDKYYFDLDIRKHFGLDKYNTNVIPYWKTETVEAMTAFQYKDGFNNGAGECVSLAALYAAAMFIVGKIPLEDIFLMSTPLHSQNFINVNEGVLTNNRRIVTKNMWFNGTVLSSRARRALENEKVTIVSHLSGYIHTVFDEATIDPSYYSDFTNKIKSFLKTNISAELFVNFLRYDSCYKKCFQYLHLKNGREYYIGLEKVFEYEHSSRNNFSEKSRMALLQEIDAEEFSLSPLENRVLLNDIEIYLNENKHLSSEAKKEYFYKKITIPDCTCNKKDIINNVRKLFENLEKFIHVSPRLPLENKIFIKTNFLNIHSELSRDEIMQQIVKESSKNETALLALYAYRQMDLIDWKPFFKAAFERNPFSVESLNGKTSKEIYNLLLNLPDDSIYDAQRLAQPDEVWNFKRGDGIEKAILLANFLIHHSNSEKISLEIDKEKVMLYCNENVFMFHSNKKLKYKKEVISNYDRSI